MPIKLSEKQIRDGWQIVKFGEIAKEVKSASKTPLKDGLEFYIGLEHLNPQSLRIVRKGIIAEDNPSFTRRFSVGQILFAKRRCYQKKAAIADFEGICSNDIIVMDEISGKIIPGLLPFIIQSDAFFDWAEKTSSGSLSPRTKWKSLAEFEFPLPPIERQKAILEVLEKASAVQERKHASWSISNQLLKSYFSEYLCVNSNNLKNDCKKKGWKLLTVGDVLIISNNQRKPLATAIRANLQGQYPYYGSTGIIDYITYYKYNGKYALIGEDGDHFLKWHTQPMTQLVMGKFNVNNHAHVLKESKNCSIEWFYFYFYHQSIEKYLTRQGAGRYKLTKDTLAKIPIPVPPMEEQIDLCNAAEQIVNQTCLFEKENLKASSLVVKLASELIFGGAQ